MPRIGRLMFTKVVLCFHDDKYALKLISICCPCLNVVHRSTLLFCHVSSRFYFTISFCYHVNLVLTDIISLAGEGTVLSPPGKLLAERIVMFTRAVHHCITIYRFIDSDMGTGDTVSGQSWRGSIRYEIDI